MSAINFQSIRYTTEGLECYYIGARILRGQVIHRFAVANSASEQFCYYDENGRRIDYDSSIGKWVVQNDGHQIIAPPKIVEVTRWIGYYWNKEIGEVCANYFVQAYPGAERDYLKLLKITESIEVPND